MADSTRHFITGNTYPVKDQLRDLGCRWDGSRKAWYTEDAEIAAKAAAIVGPTPLYNSPPPQDLGTVDPAALAARHGRRAVEGATVASFNVYGLPKGDDGDKNGTVHRIRGKRYVQVARSGRRYYSRDMLEDFDMFNEEPGGSYQWDGVEVEPTAEEAAADQAKADAKAKAEQEAAAAKAKRKPRPRHAPSCGKRRSLDSSGALPHLKVRSRSRSAWTGPPTGMTGHGP